MQRSFIKYTRLRKSLQKDLTQRKYCGIIIMEGEREINKNELISAHQFNLKLFQMSTDVYACLHIIYTSQRCQEVSSQAASWHFVYTSTYKNKNFIKKISQNIRRCVDKTCKALQILNSQAWSMCRHMCRQGVDSVTRIPYIYHKKFIQELFFSARINQVQYSSLYKGTCDERQHFMEVSSARRNNNKVTRKERSFVKFPGRQEVRETNNYIDSLKVPPEKQKFPNKVLDNFYKTLYNISMKTKAKVLNKVTAESKRMSNYLVKDNSLAVWCLI